MLQFIVVGLVLGSIYALAASGLVITYVSTGVLNFAFGSLAFFIARSYYYLHVEKEWGILAVGRGLPARARAAAWGSSSTWRSSGSCGLSSQLIKVVVTIGLSVVIPRARDDASSATTRSSRRPASRPSRSPSTRCSTPR